jgi:peptidoglycan/LPS O-acetylase OafA/YrhL
MTVAYRAEIDGLRAVAVLQIVLYHASAGIPAGFVGVDVFFVISGYLITRTLMDEWATTGRIDLAAFSARRVRRIVPALLLVIVLVLAVASQLLAAGAFVQTAGSAAAAALFVANFYFPLTGGGYFDPPSEELPLLHLWSLSVEEQFYLLWPLLLLGVLRADARWLRLALVGMMLASFALAQALLRAEPEAAFYFAPARFWELGTGGLIATLAIRQPRPLRLLALPGLVLVVAAGFSHPGYFSAAAVLPAVLGSAALLLVVHAGADTGVAGALLRSAPLRGVGLVSYSFYLWHWPLLALQKATSIGAGSLAARLLACVAALVLAMFTYRYVEQPCRRVAARGAVILAGVFAVLLFAAGALAWGEAARQQDLGTDSPLARATEADSPPDGMRCHYQRDSRDFPRAGCASRADREPSLAIWGDSMALAWKPLLWRMAHGESAAAIAYSRDSCPPLLGLSGDESLDPRCAGFNQQVIVRLHGMRLVVLALSLGDQQSLLRADQLRGTLEALSPYVERVIVLGPSPHMPDAVPKCIRAGRLAQCSVPRAAFDAVAVPQLAVLRAHAAHFDNVDVVDVTEFFCDAASCAPLRDGYALYWDRYHVSTTAVNAFADRYLAGLRLRAPSAADRLCTDAAHQRTGAACVTP